MKTSQTHSLKYWASFSFLLVLLGTACGQANKKSPATTDTKTETSTVQPPAMDIHAAVIAGNIEAVQQHIEAGTDINQKDAMSSSTPLISAASFGKIKVAKALIDAGADLTPKNNDGSTALHAAAFFCRVEIVQLLMDANVDKTIRNNFGATARESLLGPFTEIKPVYEMLQQQLSPFGMQLDMEEIEETRPVIAMMLQ